MAATTQGRTALVDTNNASPTKLVCLAQRVLHEEAYQPALTSGN